jgi:DNA-binding NtrC family response regulator
METVLDVERDSLGASAFAAVLADEYRLIACPNPESLPGFMERERPSAILFDLSTYEDKALSFLSEMTAGYAKPPVIVISPVTDPHIVVQAVRCGAADFVGKPVRLTELRASLRRVLSPPEPPRFIGASPATRRTIELIRNYARSSFPVLILGESGTGKEIAARAIHDFSQRSLRPFLPRNCAALPEELIESELFGSARGAFTGAVERPGAFELADGGTLFLDEIGEASAGVQAKLLRALESGDLWRLGDSKARMADVRLVSATARDLKAAEREGRFRSDLLYRIDTLILELPPLRERREDVPGLAEHFARAAIGRKKHFSAFALERLANEAWPGNVRQLKNTVHRAIVLSGDLEEIGEEHIVIY